MSGAVSSYGTRHLQALFGSLGRLARAPLATLLTLMVIGVALALPAGLALVVANLRAATGDLGSAVDFTVHFKIGTPIERVQQIATGARARSEIQSVTVTTADQALEEFKTTSGFGDALAALKDNPLPHHLTVRPTRAASGPAEVESLRRYFTAFPEVEIVQLDLDWVRRLHSLLEVIRRTLWVVIAVLGLGVLAVIGNTIRLEIQQRRPEIEVTKLVGGSNAFVRRPFLYTGLFYGLGGALLAALIVFGGMTYLDQAVRELSAQYGGSFRMAGLGPRGLGILAGVGAALGWFGALISTGRHLRQIEPRA
ncbi:MAG TPA: permease-like cell division protein FtsX [Steroidobacteraceae bacterium]|jgi:cell division transport system permease protein|nr:permease-like cell division protein FtsX [Steroidobacteraceae bacterium]